MQSVVIYYKDEADGKKIDHVGFIPLSKKTREEIRKKAAEYNARKSVYRAKIIDDPLIEAAFNTIRPLEPPYRQPEGLIDDIENLRNELSNFTAAIESDLELILDRLRETPTQEATK